MVQGVAKVLAARSINVGDPLTPASNSGLAPGKSNSVARVSIATTNYDTFIGRCLSVATGTNQVADILVDISGGYDTAVPTVLPLSTDATLSGLTLTPSSIALSPSFSAATTAYTASVSNTVASLRVTPTVNQANATVTVNGTAVASGQQSGQIALSVGSNTITVVVTAQDGSTTRTYTLALTRAAAPMPANNAPSANAGADQTVDTGTTVTL